MFLWKERTWTCGPTALRIALEKLGIERTERYLEKILRTTPRTGTPNRNFVRGVRKLKLEYVVRRNATYKIIEGYMKDGYSVIISFYSMPNKCGHFAVVKKITKKRIFLQDPSLGPNLSYSKGYFTKLWYSYYDQQDKKWLLAIKRSSS